MAGQQFPVGFLDMVGVPSAGDLDAHLRGPVVDSAALCDRAVEDLDQPLREVRSAPVRRGRTAPPARLRRREPIETGGARRWDPFFMDFMTLADVYRYPTQHFDFHRQQLTLPDAPNGDQQH